MQRDSEFLATEKPSKLLLKLALPAVTAQLVNMLYNIVDRMYIGRLEGIGTEALAGVGACMPVILLVSAFAALASMGGAPRASIFMGRGDRESAERTMGNCMTLLLFLAALLTAALLIFQRPILLAFGALPETLPYALEYMNIYAIGTVFVQAALGMNAFITAQGFSRTSMLTVLIGAVLNIGLDPLFMFTFDMGVKGAALATILSQAVSAAWVIWFLCGRRTVLRLRLRFMAPRPKLLLPCLALGRVAVYHAGHGGGHQRLLQPPARPLRRGAGRQRHDHPRQRHAVRHAAFAGADAGRAAITSYNYGAKNASRVRASFRALLAACMIYAGGAVAGGDALPARLRRPVQHRCGAYRLYRQSPARLHGRGRALRRAIGLPADLHRPRQRPKAPSSSPCCARSYCSSPSSTSFPPCCPWTRPWPCTSPSRWPTSSP